MYLVNPDPSLASWSYFLTANGATVSAALAAGTPLGDIIATQPQLFIDDSGWELGHNSEHPESSINNCG
jgi:hypothetical protein